MDKKQEKAPSIKRKDTVDRPPYQILFSFNMKAGRKTLITRRKEEWRKEWTNIGTVSRTALRKLLRDGAERVWTFPSAMTPS